MCNWRTGRYCGHIKIGDNVKIQGQSGVISNIKENSTFKVPLLSYNDYNKSYVYFKNLPNILKEINRIIRSLTYDKKNLIKNTPRQVTLDGVGLHTDKALINF